MISVIKKGASVKTIFLTDGECLNGDPSSEVASLRRTEALSASKMLGCKAPLFLSMPDGGLDRHIEDGFNRILGVLTTEKPDMLLCPSPLDYHNDHIATAKIAIKLFNSLGCFRLGFYEVYSAYNFTHLSDITDIVEDKKRLISIYKTSLYNKPEIYSHSILGLNAHRSIFVQKSGYLEAFYIASRYEKLINFYPQLDLSRGLF